MVTLRTDVLIRALGPLAGLLQRALTCGPSPPLSEAASPEVEWSFVDSQVDPGSHVANGSQAGMSSLGSGFQAPPISTGATLGTSKAAIVSSQDVSAHWQPTTAYHTCLLYVLPWLQGTPTCSVVCRRQHHDWLCLRERRSVGDAARAFGRHSHA